MIQIKTHKKFKDIKILNFLSYKDKRGNFSRLYCKKELKDFKLFQINLSHNIKKHTLRGIHYQSSKYAEEKIINCLKGRIFFVCVNLNIRSSNYLKNFNIILDEKDKMGIYIPSTYGTAFLTLKNNTEVLYFMSNFYNKKYSSGIKYDDPKLNIKWPFKPKIISDKDSNLRYL